LPALALPKRQINHRRNLSRQNNLRRCLAAAKGIGRRLKRLNAPLLVS